MYNILLIIHLVLFIVSLLYIGIVLLEKASDTSKYLFAASISVFLVIMGYILELMGTDRNFSLVSLKVQLLGLFFLNSFLLFFIAKCCNSYIPTCFRVIFLTIDSIFLLFVMTAEYHKFFFTDLSFVTDGYYSRIVVTEGVVCRISHIYNMLMILGFIAICIVDYFKNKKSKSFETLFLPICYCPTAIAAFIYYGMGVGRIGFNPVPASVVIGMGFLLFMVYRFRLLDTRQVAMDSIAENVNEGYIVLDVGKNLLFANKIAYDIFPGLYNAKEKSAIIEEVFAKNTKYMEVDNKSYQVSVSPFYDRRTLKGYSMWLFDKTEEIESTKRLIELKDKAEEANRAKTVFLATMSHELRTPMNAIMGTTELLLHSSPEPEVEEKVEDISRAGNVLLQIISGILDFSKIESGELELVEFNYDTLTYLRDTLSMFDKRINEKGLDFRLIISPTMPRELRGDATHLRQIITNLLDNACKYTKKGFIAFKADWEEMEDDTVRLNFTVADSGIGIKEKSIPYLFDSFKREDIRQNIDIEGTGLGLAIAKRLTEGMGGEIGVESTYGEGSSFSFYVYQKVVNPVPIGEFTLERGDSGSNMEKEEWITAPGARVLCVDDNETNRKVIRDLLSLLKIEADTASSGAQCLSMLSEDDGYHMIFMDYMMPYMDGIETAERVRLISENAAKIPIIALTANAVAGAQEMFLQNGFVGYLSKPVDMKSIQKILVEFLPPGLIRKEEHAMKESGSEKEIIFPEVDTKSALERYGNDLSRYLQVLSYIYEDGEKQISRIRTAMDEGNINDYACEVHAVKGVMKGIGAVTLSEMAGEAEKNARAEEPFIDRAKTEELIAKYEVLLANIGFALTDHGLIHSKITGDLDEGELKEALSEEEWDENLAKALEAIGLLDEKAAETILKEILSHSMEEDRREALKKALVCIKEFEYEEAQKIINGVIK